MKLPCLRNHLRLINNKNTSPIPCSAQVFFYNMVFYVRNWTGMASNNTISWSATYDSTAQYWPISTVNMDLHRRFISTPRWSICPYFCFNPMVVHRKTCVLMYLQYYYDPFMAKITFDTKNLGVSLWQLQLFPKLRCTTPGVWLFPTSFV